MPVLQSDVTTATAWPSLSSNLLSRHPSPSLRQHTALSAHPLSAGPTAASVYFLGHPPWPASPGFQGWYLIHPCAQSSARLAREGAHRGLLHESTNAEVPEAAEGLDAQVRLSCLTGRPPALSLRTPEMGWGSEPLSPSLSMSFPHPTIRTEPTSYRCLIFMKEDETGHRVTRLIL